MKINDMFQKKINRPIQGVVKIGQDDMALIANELDEYVVTKELHRHFDKFFEMYRKGTQQRTDKIGVWISGFFGSGKSHFLKILSYLLGGETYDGKKAIEYFEGKISDNRIMADMQLASDTNADVILFNIDAEADADSKSNKDPIVKVFMKVFNRMQGFCGSVPWIAELERHMVNDGNYEAFCKRFEEIAGNSWQKLRNRYFFERAKIIQALSETTSMTQETAVAWFNKAEENYSLDINSFAGRVREYIEEKEKQSGKKHFVVFLCDEVGQYIGSSGALMLNLQNIVEGLGNECGGRAWVIATGQEDIDTIARMKSEQRDAFSKIIGRFDTRLSLSSANVDEVIKKRLLAKREVAKDKLHLLFEEKSTAIRNLIRFSDGTPEKRLYDSAEDFSEVYPFIPYQFKLLQEVFNGIRTHGASGKHLSEGERSLLNAFQEAAIEFMNYDDGVLIPFDAFYRTVETFLDHNIRRVILYAEDSAALGNALNLDSVAVLKVLFMIKYISNSLPANFDNILALMLTSIDEDKVMTSRRISDALLRLEAERLITRHGSQYIFLTNDEQDVNREIRNTPIDQNALIDAVGKEIFDVLFGVERKYRHNDRHDFTFNALIDNRPVGNQKDDIALHVLTPYYGNSALSDSDIKVMSMRHHQVIVGLPSSSTEFLDEMEQAMQIEAFLFKHSGKTGTDAIEDIKSTKVREMAQRKARCRDLIEESLRKAGIFVNSQKLEIREKAPRQRINEGFDLLIEQLYYKQSYVVQSFLTVESLRELLAAKDDRLITLDTTGVKDINHLAITDMTDIIEKSHYRNLSTTLRTMHDTFSKMPFGWLPYDIVGIVLTLFKNQKIRLEYSGENVATDDMRVIDWMIRREHQERLVIKWRDHVHPSLIANAKDVAFEVFNRTDLPYDQDGIMTRIKEFATIELSEINHLLGKYTSRYPGKKILDDGKKLLEQTILFKDAKSFYEYLQRDKESLLDYEEDVQDVKRFFKNQNEQFDNALKMLDIYEGNRAYVLDAETVKLVDDIEKITRLPSPYSEIHKLPDLVDKFRTNFGRLLEEECVPIQANIEADRDVTLIDLRRRDLNDSLDGFEKRIISDYGALLERLTRVNNIYEAIAMQTESDRMKQRYIQSFIEEEARLARLEAEKNNIKPEDIPLRKTKTLTLKNLFAGTTQISSEDDIERVVNEVRTRLKAQLEADTTLHIV